MNILLMFVHFLEYVFLVFAVLVALVAFTIPTHNGEWWLRGFYLEWKRSPIFPICGLKERLHLDEYCHSFSLVTHDWRKSELVGDERIKCRNCGQWQYLIWVRDNIHKWVDQD